MPTPETLDAWFLAAQQGDFAAIDKLARQEPSLLSARDDTGATALHHAAFLGQRGTAELLAHHGADLNARDDTHGTTPAGWAIEYLRELGALIATEIDDAAFAIDRGDTEWLARFVARHPALATARTRDGALLSDLAAARGDAQMIAAFDRARTAIAPTPKKPKGTRK